MIIVTEEKGTLENSVQAAVHITGCTSTTVISELPDDEFEKASFGAPRIYDVKFQIDTGIKYADTQSEFFYVDEQDLAVTAIIDSKNPLKRVELRMITLGQPDDAYIAIKMDAEPLPISESAYMVTGSIPSFLMQGPAIAYWIHVIDEELNEVQSKHYTMGVKPITEPDVSVRLDVHTVKETGSTVRPKLYVNNEQSPSYGVASLVVDGKAVSQKAQLFETGQTSMSFDWTVPESAGIAEYDIQGRVNLYGTSIITSPAKLHSYSETVLISAYDMKQIKLMEKDGQVLATPALIYASDPHNGSFKFRVTAPDGQCIIGPSSECSVQDSTRKDRGGLSSIQYGEQMLRVKYTGPDNPLERFSITSVDPIVGDWTVTLETEEGFIPQAQALKDTVIKVKYRINSEIITVYSD